MFRTFLAMFLIVISLNSQARQFVVIESTATKINVGALLNPEFNLELNNQEKLTLISETGELHVMKGPFRGNLGKLQSQQSDKASLGLVLGRILNERSDDLRTLGTVRRLGNSINVFLAQDNRVMNLVSAEYDGVQCVVSGQPVQLVREQPKVDEQAQLRVADGAYQPLGWSAGQMLAQWPAQIPVEDGRVYLLRRSTGSIPYRLQFRKLDASFVQASPAFQMATLISRNCVVQAKWIQNDAGL